VQTKETKYTPLIGPKDAPATWLNRETHGAVPAGDAEVLLDAARYRTYLEQPGVSYPMVEKEP
jgi:aminobenzoyl-glutamate utilization protein B